MATVPQPTQDVESAQPLLGDSSRDAGVVVVGDAFTANATSAYAFISHVALCVLFGAVAAIAFKTVGKLVLVAVIVIFILVQVLAYYGYVNLNWRQVGRAFKGKLDANNDGRLDLADMKIWAKKAWTAVIGYGVPSVAGFGVGFLLGWWWA